MNWLEINQQREVIFTQGDIVLYYPTEDQVGELKEILRNQNININEEQNQIDYSVVRYIIRNCCNEGAFIDEYTDEELDNKFSNGNIILKRLEREVIKLIEEISEDILFEFEQQVKGINSILTALESAKNMENLKTKFNKVAKKYKLKVTFDDIMNNADMSNELEKIIKENKK